MIIALYIAAAVIMAVGSLYFAWRTFANSWRGAFFVSSGILFYLRFHFWLLVFESHFQTCSGTPS
jgi:hypothetical protein